MKQITLPAVNIDVQQVTPEQRALVISEMTNGVVGDVFIIPMPNKVAETIGQKLAAPSIQTAPASALIRP